MEDVGLRKSLYALGHFCLMMSIGKQGPMVECGDAARLSSRVDQSNDGSQKHVSTVATNVTARNYRSFDEAKQIH